MFKKKLPAKKIVIAGCRDYNNYDEAKPYIDYCLSEVVKEYSVVIISGGASGADAIGERYAKERGYKIEKHPADWEKYGKSAGPIRNREMAESCDMAICFWNGESRGTKSMIEFVTKLGKPIRIKKI